jgi:hypothetical protein
MFKPFGTAIHNRFMALSQHELYVTAAGQDVWDKYLASFPEGTNPIFKTNTEHDCSCCKQFVRNIGPVVAIIDGRMQSLWSVENLDSPYKEVAEALDAFVLSQPISDLFRPSESSYGAELTPQLVKGLGQQLDVIIPWSHFHGVIAQRHRSATPDKARGDYRTSMQVFRRGLEELKPAAVAQTLELIDSNAIYRGAEFKTSAQAFRVAQTAFLALPEGEAREVFLWENAAGPASRFRNSAIGTLVTDLSDGVDLEHAVRSFESKTAPTNYKRPTALVTPSMIKQAVETVATLGLETALERRMAAIGDITMNNVLWADNSAKAQMKGGLQGMLETSLASAVPSAPAEAVSIDDFMAKVLPKAKALDIKVIGSQLNNLVTLTAPEHSDAGRLFKWDNAFGWSYSGNIADSIKERVKAAGGNVTNAKLRISLSWFNYDDLDLHVYEPTGRHIYFGNKEGKLDVDMNAGGGRSSTPVENVSYKTLTDGVYRVVVNQFCQREASDVGCVIELESGGNLTQLSFNSVVKGNLGMCDLHIKDGLIAKIDVGSGVVGGGVSQEKWGITTESFVPVKTLMYSPNYWDEQAVGNKHWFFMLKGCKNPEPARGIYNEFLRGDLEQHRKVFEMLGDKTKCQPTDNQLSGLGFSSTRQDTVTVKVTLEKGARLYNISF